MKLQQLLSVSRKAIDEFNMIQSGDCIAVGVSGGKDSLALLLALRHLQRFYPKKYSLQAVTVDLGFPNVDFSKIQSFCVDIEVPFTRVKTEIANIVFYEKREKNPCSLCAKMRKGAFNDAIKELGCNKVAYAHHRDDVVETLLLSLIFEGRFHTFSPVTYWDRMDLTLIRPFVFMKEADIIGFQNKYQLPVAKSPCPADGRTKREYAKNLLKELNQDHPGAKDRIFAAILSGNLKGWDSKRKPQRSSMPE
ncbi:MAG: tRNA 2-thiocytidine(32) synthetase TtcA [Lachnospiraceae bacterium]|nr:tRNA 2-thiocytidine(32) synthetase TtcA [Lachnospiraceae bacterium]